MRSLESRRHHDLDQVDPEHLSHETRETKWDDLKNVPFSGEQAVRDTKAMKAMIDSLPTDVDDEIEIAAKAVEDARMQDTIKRMDDLGSFGRSAPGTRIERSTEKPGYSEEDFQKTLSEISETF